MHKPAEAWFGELSGMITLKVSPFQAQRIQEALDVALNHYSELENGSYEAAVELINILHKPLVDSGAGVPV